MSPGFSPLGPGSRRMVKRTRGRRAARRRSIIRPCSRAVVRALRGTGGAVVPCVARGCGGVRAVLLAGGVAFDVVPAARVSSALTLTMLIFGGRSVSLRMAPVLVSAL